MLQVQQWQRRLLKHISGLYKYFKNIALAEVSFLSYHQPAFSKSAIAFSIASTEFGNLASFPLCMEHLKTWIQFANRVAEFATRA